MIKKMLNFIKRKEKDKYPLVPALKEVYDEYSWMKFDEGNEEKRERDLNKLVETVNKDSRLQKLLSISGRLNVLVLSDGVNLNLDGNGLYVYDLVVGGGCIEYEKETRGKDILPMLEEIGPNKLKEGVLNYIKKCLYTPY